MRGRKARKALETKRNTSSNCCLLKHQRRNNTTHLRSNSQHQAIEEEEGEGGKKGVWDISDDGVDLQAVPQVVIDRQLLAIEPRPFSDQPLPRAPTSRRCVSFVWL